MIGALSHSPEDEGIVEAQLGRTPRGVWAVARRCHLGVPMVVESHPVRDDGTPFPTLFWLTCPVLVKRASVLESRGAMAEWSHALGRDPDLRDRVAQAVERYRERRNRHAVVRETGGPPGGGPDRVKCLHAHVAHELADPPNPVGSATLAVVGWPDCRTPCAERVT